MAIKTYRVFYHYNRHNNGMTVHFKGKCWPCKNVDCNVRVETKWSNTQPHLVMQGYAREIIVIDDLIMIE